MALFSLDKPMTLQDVLGNQADLAAQGQQDQYVQKKRRLVSQEAHNGRLGSGVSDYPLADLEAGNASDTSDIYGNLAAALGAVPAEDSLNQNDYARKLKLAKLIGDQNKPSALQEALGGLQAAGNVAALFAMA